MKNFSELSLCPVLQSNLLKHGFILPTPVQAEAIPPGLAGRDVVATAQTGTGKTLAFLLPLIESLMKATDRRGVQAVILSPTRELAIQIAETFVKLAAGSGIRAATVVGGMSEARQLQALRAGAQVVIATPGRLCDFINRNLVNLGSGRIFVLDEADRMLDMGFLPSLRIIMKTMPAVRQTLLFSATIEKSVAHLIESHVKNPVRVSIGATTKPIEQIELRLYEVEQDRKLGLLSGLLQQEQGSFLVFARTKHGAERLAEKLIRTGVTAGRIHGDRSQSQRNQALNSFKVGAFRVLVATDVAARGIHVDNIAHVVNYDLPQAPGDFIHRVGRTGRAGARGVASTFSTPSERGDIRAIERELSVRLTPVKVGADVPRETRQGAHVIVMPAAGRQDVPVASRPRVRSFAPRKRRFAGR
jgi:ATP-dependent RNA helicase RhlE